MGFAQGVLDGLTADTRKSRKVFKGEPTSTVLNHFDGDHGEHGLLG